MNDHQIRLNCRFSYAGTWELVNLFVGTKYLSYHSCYENIGKGRKHNKILWSQERDIPWTDRPEQYASKEEYIKWNKKEGTFTQGFKVSRTAGKSKGKYLKNLDDLQNLLINLKPAQRKHGYFSSFHLV